MSIKLKPLDEQVMVITGASSGIGLATAETAAARGVKLILAARSEQTLQAIVGRISQAGGEAIAVACDVAERSQLERLASEAIARFGRIDTWVNDAGLGMYGMLEEGDDGDYRRLFDINFWGVVNGSLIALPHLRKQGGALINVGSEVSEASVPLLGMYTASKHAVKGFTDSLRIEIEEVGKEPIAVTLIQPTAVNTPFPQHARNYMQENAKLPDAMIDPQDVADAILEAATKHTRDKKQAHPRQEGWRARRAEHGHGEVRSWHCGQDGGQANESASRQLRAATSARRAASLVGSDASCRPQASHGSRVKLHQREARPRQSDRRNRVLIPSRLSA